MENKGIPEIRNESYYNVKGSFKGLDFGIYGWTDVDALHYDPATGKAIFIEAKAKVSNDPANRAFYKNQWSTLRGLTKISPNLIVFITEHGKFAQNGDTMFYHCEAKVWGAWQNGELINNYNGMLINDARRKFFAE